MKMIIFSSLFLKKIILALPLKPIRKSSNRMPINSAKLVLKYFTLKIFVEKRFLAFCIGINKFDLLYHLAILTSKFTLAFMEKYWYYQKAKQKPKKCPWSQGSKCINKKYTCHCLEICPFIYNWHVNK